MLEFFQTIVDGISFLFSFVGMLLTGIFQFLTMIPQMLVFVTTMTAFIPTFLLVFFMGSVSIALIMVLVKGRG